MNLTLPVQLPLKELNIGYENRLMLMGSCFAENMGRYLTDNKFLCDVNPYGILYNPLSIAASLDEIIERRTYVENDDRIFFFDGLWHSYMHHGSFSATEKSMCIQQINSRLEQAHHEIANTDVLIVTLGTAFAYRLKENNRVVSNCHKLPDKMFIRSLLSVDEVVGALQSVIEKLLIVRPTLKMLFTVSPIRHLKDGAVGNQLSKSTLLLAVQSLKQLYQQHCFYFPAYEIMMDELRDYRFYDEDMVHPSSTAVAYIWECFQKCYFSTQTFEILNEWREIKRGLEHKPFNPNSDNYRIFIHQIVSKMEVLYKKFPYFDLANEIQTWHIQLKQ